MAANMVAANMAAVNIAAANIATGNMALIGKRAVSNSTEDDQIQVNQTFCSYSSQRGILSCHGIKNNFDCDVTPRLSGFEKLKLKLSDLELVPAEEGNFNILRLLNPNSKFTVVEPFNKKQIVLSLFNAEHPSEPGFMIRDSACWSNVESLVRENQRENVRLAIFL
ncbi:unnamed protein product [Brachionus calyciflorus]|nr:unnamed protein product [Brachionus calyciflorus]